MNKPNIQEGLLAAAGFASALFLFLPLVVYVLNLGSVATPKMTILLCGGLLAAVTATILVAAMFIPRLGRLAVVSCQIGLIAVVVLTVFPNRTGEITGFGAFLPSLKSLMAAAKLLAVCGLGAWLAWKKPQLLESLSRYCLAVVLLVTGYVACFPLSVADKSASMRTSIPTNFTELGETSNVIVVIFDSFTGYRMAEVLKDYPKLRTELDGFVYYPQTLASALSTPAGVSAILTGDLKSSLIDADTKVRNPDTLRNSFLFDASRLGLSTGIIGIIGSKDILIRSNSRPL